MMPLRFIASMAVLAAIEALSGCSSELDQPVLFRLPAGFRGLISLTVDEKRGASITHTGHVYEISIPADGSLLVRNIRVLQRWHVLFAEYDNGMPIPIAAKIEDEKVVALHSLPFVSHDRNGKEQKLYYFLGTKAECDLARRKL